MVFLLHRKEQLSRVERFRVTIFSATLDPTEPQQPEESLLTEPVLRALSSENIEERFALPACDASWQRNVHVRLTKVSVPLRNLVFEDEMLAERIPREIRDDAMILVPVGACVGENDVGLELAGQALKRILDCIELCREVTIAEFVQQHGALRCSSEEFARSVLRFARSMPGSAQHHPAELRLRFLSRKLRQRAAAPDLDIIRMRAQAKNPERAR